MPAIEWGNYILDFLFEVGPTMAVGMGSAPLTFAEIEAWQRMVGIELSPFEAKLLRSLSVAYLDESYAATKRDCPPPYAVCGVGSVPIIKRNPQREIERKLDAFFG